MSARSAGQLFPEQLIFIVVEDLFEWQPSFSISFSSTQNMAKSSSLLDAASLFCIFHIMPIHEFMQPSPTCCTWLDALLFSGLFLSRHTGLRPFVLTRYH